MEGPFAGSPPLVFIEDRFLATQDRAEVQVLFELIDGGMRKVREGGNCEPVFWRTSARQLVCHDESGLRSQDLSGSLGELLIDTDAIDLGAVLHYWPHSDEVLGLVHRGSLYRNGHFLYEFEDLVKINLANGKATLVKTDVDIDVRRFVYLGPN